jgi:hypothetical protein
VSQHLDLALFLRTVSNFTARPPNRLFSQLDFLLPTPLFLPAIT